MLWFGLYISASSVFKRLQYLSVLSPVFVYLLITRLSGIPLLEKAGLKKWGHLPEYQNYIKNTPCFIPFINWGWKITIIICIFYIYCFDTLLVVPTTKLKTVKLIIIWFDRKDSCKKSTKFKKFIDNVEL